MVLPVADCATSTAMFTRSSSETSVVNTSSPSRVENNNSCESISVHRDISEHSPLDSSIGVSCDPGVIKNGAAVSCDAATGFMPRFAPRRAVHGAAPGFSISGLLLLVVRSADAIHDGVAEHQVRTRVVGGRATRFVGACEGVIVIDVDATAVLAAEYRVVYLAALALAEAQGFVTRGRVVRRAVDRAEDLHVGLQLECDRLQLESQVRLDT